MKKITIKYALIAFVGLFISIGFSACSSWPDPESVKINMPTADNTNPVYLASLRAYKQTNHKVVYAWYNNTHTQVVQSRGQHIDALPDSIDYIVLMNPDSLANREKQEIDTVRNQKGTKVLLSIDYDAIKTTYDLSLAPNTPENTNDLNALLTSKVNYYLSLVSKYNYDGVIFKYNGISPLLLSPTDLATFTSVQANYLSLISTWYTANSSMLLVFQGHPENLLDTSLLSSCKNIIIDCTDAVSAYGLGYDIELSIAPNIPTDRFVALVSIISSDPTDVKTGYFSDGTLAVPQTAIWVAQPSNNYTKAGLGIYNVQNDYYNPTFTYSSTRTAINTMNPSPNVNK